MATILTKKSDTASAVPLAADLTNAAGGAELAVNATDKRLFSKTSGGTVVELGTNPTAMAVVGNTTVGGTLGVTGATTLAGVSATTLAASSTVTLSGGTANGVAYLNGSKVVTSGSALTFDGTNFTLTSGRIRNVPSTATANGLFQSSNTGGGFYTGIEDSTGSLFAGTGYAGVVWHTGNYPIAFGLNNTEQMRLTSTGLGIGTSSPATRLDVAATEATIRLTSTTGTNFTDVRVVNTGGTLYSGIERSTGGVLGPTGAYEAFFLYGADRPMYIGTGNSYLRFGTNATERMRLDSSGNLGLGVTPSAWGSSIKAMQIGGYGVFAQSSTAFNIGNNYYNNGTNSLYINSAHATLYQQLSGQHIWYNAPSGTAGNAITFTQAMTLDASGNLLLGTTSLKARLTVNSGSSSTYASFDSTNATGGYAEFSSSGTVHGDIGTAAQIVSGGSASDFGINARGSRNLIFGTNNTERARIDSSGNLLCGTTGTSWTDTVGFYAFYQSAVNATRNGAEAMNLNRLTSDGTILGFRRSGTQVGSVSVTTTATAYNTSSDYRLKNTIAPMTGALAKVALLKPCTYKWNADGSDGEGFIAHELAEVVPQCVSGEKDAVDEEGNPKYQGIDTSFLVATLTAAIQELNAKFEAYKASHP